METTLKNKKIIRNAVVLMLIICAVLLAISFIRWITSRYILDATIDETNGNIAVLNRDYKIKVYNIDGEIVFEMELADNDGGYATLEYVNGLLNIQMVRTNVLYVVDTEGQLIKKGTYAQENENYEWDDGWKRENDAYRYQMGAVIYQYSYPTYFSSLFSPKEVTLEIINQDTGNLVLLEIE